MPAQPEATSPHPRPVAPRARRRLLYALLVVALVGCDQLAKHFASALAGRGPVVLIEGSLALRYAENHGLAFGPGTPAAVALPLLAVLTAAVVLLVLVGWQRLPHKRPVEHLGFAVVVAGALGNFVDRLVRGYVIDFVHVSSWPIFNVADLCILVGVLLLLAAPLRPRPSRQ